MKTAIPSVAIKQTPIQGDLHKGYNALCDQRVLSFNIRKRFAVLRTINLQIEKCILRYFAATMSISQMTGNKVPGH
jgi:hypothetical protein